jgi:hypothetical protein
MNPVVVLFTLGLAWAFIICVLVRPVELAGEIWLWKRRMMAWLYWLYSLLANVWIAACAYVVSLPRIGPPSD